jgi:hypothetical protein
MSIHVVCTHNVELRCAAVRVNNNNNNKRRKGETEIRAERAGKIDGKKTSVKFLETRTMYINNDSIMDGGHSQCV